MKRLIYLAAVALMISCSGQKNEKIPLLDAKNFTTEYNGKKIALYTLESGNGLTMQVSNFGCRVISLFTPDKEGNYADIVLGHPNINEYINYKGERCLGPVIGRYANRIAKGKFTVNGKEYQLPLNNNGQTLHGGPEGFDMQVWNVDSVSSNEIHFSYTSPDMEQGFPGTVKVKVVYTLTRENEWKITYEATTDKDCPVSLTQHSFFNLKGTCNGSNSDDLLMINASKYTPIDSVWIPLGTIAPVGGTPFDFRKPTAIGARINEKNTQLKNGAGYDHNWVIDRKTPNDVELVASLYDPSTGRFMEVYSDQPGLQFYSGNFLDGKVIGKYGKPQKYREAVALESSKISRFTKRTQFSVHAVEAGRSISSNLHL